jgi:hypothetical protein
MAQLEENFNLTTFDDFDNLFFEIVKKHKNDIEETIENSVKFKLEMTKEIVTFETTKIKAINKLTNKTTEHDILHFGLYDSDSETFRWLGNLNQIMKEHIEKYGNLFENIPTINKIINNENIKINKKNHYAIPYLMAIINPAFNLVRFESEDASKFIYVLINLKLKNNIDFDEFVEDIEKYKKLNIIQCV